MKRCSKPKSAVVLRAVADERKGLLFFCPFESLAVEAPQIPVGRGDIRAVDVGVLRGERGDFGSAETLIAQVPFSEGRFRGVYGLHGEFGESGLSGGVRHGCKKPCKLGN